MADILWLTKRRYMSKDLLADKYGRYFELPSHLSTMGHRIHVLVLAYRKEPDTRLEESDNLVFESIHVKRFPRYLRRAVKIIRDQNVSLIIGSSDMQFCVLAQALSRRHSLPVIFDLYDNYENYASRKIPLLRWLYYRAMRRAGAVVSFNESLLHYLEHLAPHRNHWTVFDSVDKSRFRPLDRQTCRKAYDLPEQEILIGYFGAISASRGIRVLFRAIHILRQQGLSFRLVLAGMKDKDIELTNRDEVIYLGELAHKEMPTLINACNANVICYKDDAFARHSFPVKGVEYMACKVPFVAPAVGGIVEFLHEYPQYLYKAEDAEDLARKLSPLLHQEDHGFPRIGSWQESAEVYSSYIDRLCSPGDDSLL